MLRKRILSLLLALIMVITLLPAMAVAGEVTSEEQLPPIPEGYSYYGDCYTDENENCYYHVTKPMGSSGICAGYWIDQEGHRIEDPESFGLPDRGDLPEHSEGSVTMDVDRTKNEFPSRYDAREDGLVTAMETQISGTCWAHATIAAMESNAIKQGLADNTLNLNEYHMVWNGGNGYYEGVEDSCNDGYVAEDLSKMLSDGGTPTKAGYALLNMSGAVTEDTVPVKSTGTTALIKEMGAALSYDNKYTRDITAAEILSISSKESAIKQALLNYGGLYIAFASKSGATSHESTTGEKITTYYNYTGSASSYHAVELVGWDDDFSVENFTQDVRPKQNGAWLCKNSYGSGWGVSGGFFWLSYEDSSIYGVTAVRTISNDVFDHVYMYDGVGYSTSISATKAANIFTADEDGYLTKFSIGTTSRASYTLKLYRLKEGYTSPTDGELLHTQSGSFGGKRYMDITGDVAVKKGEVFSVVLENITTCYAEGKDSTSRKFTSHEGESFYYKDGQWLDTTLQVDNNGVKKYNNLCLRVYSSKLSEQENCCVEFVCGSNRIVKYSHDGTVELPQTDGYQWVCLYNGKPFDGTGVKRDMTVEAHCYPLEGTKAKTSDCVTEYRCRYCNKEMQPALEAHQWAETVVPATQQSMGYTVNTCEKCHQTRYSDYTAYTGAQSGVCGDVHWQYVNGVLSFTGNGAIPDYSGKNTPPWEEYRESTTAIYINDGITRVGSHSLQNSSAKTLMLSDTLQEIGEYAFAGMTKLERVVFPDSLQEIDSYAFSGDTALQSVTYGKKLWYIYDYAFRGCTALTEGRIPGSISDLGTGIYYDCTAMKKLVVEEGVYEIYGNVYGVSQSAKYSLEEIELPATLEYMEYAFLRNFDRVKTVTLSDENSYYEFDEDGVLFGNNGRELCYYPANRTDKYYDVPAQVSYISDYAFHDNPYLEYLELSCGATYLYGYTVYRCNALKGITLPSALRSLYANCVYGHGGITAVFIPSSVISVNVSWITAYSGKYPAIYTDQSNTVISNYAVQKKVDCTLTHTAHSYTTVISGSEPDCTTDSERILQCACGQLKRFSGVHCYEWVTDKAANCGNSGLKHRECIFCHNCTNEGTVIPKTGSHSYVQKPEDSRSLLSPATCTTRALYCRECTYCGALNRSSTYYYGDTAPHSFTGEYRYNNNGTHSCKCANCDAWSKATQCTMVLSSGVPGADCRTAGVDHYLCSLCNGTQDRANADYGAHQYGACISNGDDTHTKTCTICRNHHIDDACHYELVESSTGADCRTQGIDSYSCTECHAVKEVANENYGEHHYVDNKCMVCGKKLTVWKRITQFFQRIGDSIRSLFRK